jgi:hypothetical protein
MPRPREPRREPGRRTQGAEAARRGRTALGPCPPSRPRLGRARVGEGEGEGRRAAWEGRGGAERRRGGGGGRGAGRAPPWGGEGPGERRRGGGRAGRAAAQGRTRAGKRRGSARRGREEGEGERERERRGRGSPRDPTSAISTPNPRAPREGERDGEERLLRGKSK